MTFKNPPYANKDEALKALVYNFYQIAQQSPVFSVPENATTEQKIDAIVAYLTKLSKFQKSGS